MTDQKLTLKQKKFIAVYEGNATEAARLAGYKGSDETLRQVGAENLTKPYITALIEGRLRKELNEMVATREMRRKFWTQIMYDNKEKTMDRIRASELLGKCEGDFINRIEHSGNFSLESLSDEELNQRLRQLREKMKDVEKEEGEPCQQ